MHLTGGNNKLSCFSPCEGLDSPLLDINKEAPPDNFLVSLSPDKSPIKILALAATTSTMTAAKNGVGETAVDEAAEPLFQQQTPGDTHDTALKFDMLGLSDMEGVRPLDGVVCENNNPVPCTISDTPKVTTSKTNDKENEKPLTNRYQPKQPRQLILKPKLSLAADPPGINKNKKLSSLRQCVTNPVQPPTRKTDKLTQEDVSKPATRVTGSTLKKSTPIKPLQMKSSLSTKKTLPAVGAPSSSAKANTTNLYANVKSKVQTGTTMPNMKGALGKAVTPSTKSQIAKVPIKAMNGVKAVSSCSGKAVGRTMHPPKQDTNKQGKLTAQQSTDATTSQTNRFVTPNNKAKQSLAFSTPGGGATTTGRVGTASTTTTPKPKAKSSLRFSALPSPQVSRANASLVCSTPALPNPKMMSSGLPSPIGVKR